VVILSLLFSGLTYADSNKLEWFESEEELRQWVDDNHLPVVLIFNSDGKIKFNNYEGNKRYDCDDYAEDLCDLAANQGYKLMECPVRNGFVWSKRVISLQGDHVGTWTKINTKNKGWVYFYVEPNPLRARVIEICPVD